MAFMEQLERTLVKVGSFTVKKTKEATEYAKLKTQILDTQNKLEQAYARAGKLYIKKHLTEEDEAMQKAIDAVSVLEEKLKDLQHEMEERKKSKEASDMDDTIE